MGGLKLQVLGKPATTAKKENLSISVLIGMGQGQNNSSVTQGYLTSRRSTFEFHLSIGLRDTDYSLFYLNINRGSERIRGQEYEDGEITIFELDEVVGISGFSIGRIIHFEQRSLLLEYFHRQYQWPNQADINSSGLSLKLGTNLL